MTVRPLLAGCTLALLAEPALACTICHSPEGVDLRHQLLEHDLLRNAAAVAAPVPVLLAAILLAARGTKA